MCLGAWPLCAPCKQDPGVWSQGGISTKSDLGGHLAPWWAPQPLPCIALWVGSEAGGALEAGLQKGREAEAMGEQAGGFLAFPKSPGSL